jgi:hypothetical protein
VASKFCKLVNMLETNVSPAARSRLQFTAWLLRLEERRKRRIYRVQGYVRDLNRLEIT